MFDKGQQQKAADGSLALQAGNDLIVVNGLSYQDARIMIKDAIQTAFNELTGIARETAKTRAEEVTEDFFQKLFKDHPKGFEKCQDPDFQHSLYTVQKEYSRTGDKELGDLLIDLLVDRSKEDQRTILQIVLNESLNVAPKLTGSHLAVISMTFLFHYTRNKGLETHLLLGQYFDKYVLPFIEKITKNPATFQHIDFTGCGSIEIGEISLEQIIAQNYQGLFMKGFDKVEIEKRGISVGFNEKFFIPCLNDSTKIQVHSLDKEVLQDWLNEHNVPSEDRAKMLLLFDENKMNNNEILTKCVEIRPYMKNVFDVWSSSQLKSLTLTSVGMAIAHANIQRQAGKFADLSIWIN